MYRLHQTVKVKSWEQIKLTLLDGDTDAGYWDHVRDEISFTKRMKRFCGTTQVISDIEKDLDYTFYTFSDDHEEFWWIAEWLDEVYLLPEELFNV